MSEPALSPALPKASLWEDFIDIFISPSDVFRRREHSGFGIPLLVLTVIFAVMVFSTKSLMQPVMDAEFARQSAHVMRANPAVTADQMEKGRKMGETFGPIFAIILLPITAMLTGLVLWLVGKIFESTQTAGAALMVATYSFFPKLIAALGGALIAYVSNPDRLTGMSKLTFGLGALLDPSTASPALVALLTRVDVFTIWTTVLLALGLHVTGKVPKGQAFLAGAIVWVIGALPALLAALRS